MYQRQLSMAQRSRSLNLGHGAWKFHMRRVSTSAGLPEWNPLLMPWCTLSPHQVAG
ncbi:hypothetical protein D3C85_766120 [compost metagenome]